MRAFFSEISIDILMDLVVERAVAFDVLNRAWFFGISRLPTVRDGSGKWLPSQWQKLMLRC